MQAIEEGAHEEVKEAVRKAEQDPQVDIESLTTNVYVDNSKRK